MRGLIVAAASASLMPTAAAAAQVSIARPTRASGATIALVLAPTTAHTVPGGGRVKAHVSAATFMTGTPQSLLVLGSRVVGGVQWLHVLLAIRPDGSTGWINSNDVTLSHTRYWIGVDLAAREVHVYYKGLQVRHFSAVVGAPSTPTPTGLTSIYEIDRQANPNGFLGSWALTLAIFSHVLMSFDGGPGEVAIHGRGGASLAEPLGSAESHGCIRVDDGPLDWLAARVPVGTPVLIASH